MDGSAQGFLSMAIPMTYDEGGWNSPYPGSRGIFLTTTSTHRPLMKMIPTASSSGHLPFLRPCGTQKYRNTPLTFFTRPRTRICFQANLSILQAIEHVRNHKKTNVGQILTLIGTDATRTSNSALEYQDVARHTLSSPVLMETVVTRFPVPMQSCWSLL